MLTRIERLLVKQCKRVAERRPDHLTFDLHAWSLLSPNWLAMVIYERGQFWVERSPGSLRLRYDLSSLWAMLFCLCVASVFLILDLINGHFLRGPIDFGLAFGGLYGGNLLLAFARIPGAIRKAVSDF